ncbi:hypothetical protein Ssi03_58890 [Sphaerisporangium siamense]|uniref:Putative membrane protein YkgB n=1 Tax=Sphaerisporangium siamense TaxID=795645 RepID=A0A7W7D3N2_9ACTN|nr:DoxX family membrane protein [Sphaerisporangium siamense]MBB4699719.1 putative membrane protein YkgB [Sphaerisporangium siamense]GII87899.1 hypothetical protein Ssi03_58890 [Sphaerisporangium siamense]
MPTVNRRRRPPQQPVAGIEATLVALLRRRAPDVMRWALGLVFLWFGALKVANATPVGDLVADTLSFVPVPASILVPALGLFEIAVGVLLVINRWLRPVLVALLCHLAGTFLVLVVRPDTAFKGGNVLMLTMEGEFVVKNVVLIAATLLVAATLPSRTGDSGPVQP